jgi:hypothetical protein
MKPFLQILFAVMFLLIIGCSGNHLIQNEEYLGVVEKSFDKRIQLAANRDAQLFSVFKQNISSEQTEAMKFLIAFMPLSDLADYTGDFFLANADLSLRTRTEMPWGKNIPEEIFLHYVLPCRVNNENLDSFRIVYYNEIADRIKGKEIGEAALEINHWCHEKVSYQSADIRTSGPMSTILSARGRCGEESTFTVAALRTAGIPARQVYTPRWAHSDDNHAWVEIWINGEWYYMGACEPEPVLDRGWFTEPARRAMLVHTKSFGAFLGNENYINKYESYSDVNNLSKYAVTKTIFVKVTDSIGKPLNNARVEYQLYNYAEFYPIAVVPTNENGISRFETGLGDLLIWAGKDDDFDYKKISVSETDTVTLRLMRNRGEIKSLDLDLDVPVVRSPLAGPPQQLIEKNTERVNLENLIRQKYIDSWIKTPEVKSLAIKLNLDTTKLIRIFERSMGNYNEIRTFLSVTPDSLRYLAVSMLEILPDKDLRDTKEDVLSDHLINYVRSDYKTEGKDPGMFLNYVLNPRIANELIVGWRSYFRINLPAVLTEKASSDPLLIVKYLNENIIIANDENYYKTPISPKGVNELKVSDDFSRSICFVAICRSLGIPSRLEPGSNIPQFFLNNNWTDVYFADQKQLSQQKGYLKFVSSSTNPVPEYYIHFTIARFENGRYNTLEYDYNKKVTDFKEELSLLPGKYMLVTGNRLNDSKILSNISFFDLGENEHKTIEIKLRKDLSDKKILGRLDFMKVLSLFNKDNCSPERLADKGAVIMWIDPEKEPTKHIFNDLPLLKSELDSWGGYFLFLSDSLQNKGLFKPEGLKGLPANSLFGTDNNMSQLCKSFNIKSISDISLPCIVLVNMNGDILFKSSGYRIGIGEQILKNIR